MLPLWRVGTLLEENDILKSNAVEKLRKGRTAGGLLHGGRSAQDKTRKGGLREGEIRRVETRHGDVGMILQDRAGAGS